MTRIKITFLIILILILGIGGYYLFRNLPKASTSKVIQKEASRAAILMYDDHFEPSEIQIPLNTLVEFKNMGSDPHWPASDLHPTHGIYPEFDSLKGIEPGKSWEFLFDKKGKWKFHDHLNPLVRGVITVQ